VHPAKYQHRVVSSDQTPDFLGVGSAAVEQIGFGGSALFAGFAAISRVDQLGKRLGISVFSNGKYQFWHHNLKN